MNNTKRTEKSMKVLPASFTYLSDLKHALRKQTGISMSFNDVFALMRHRFPVERMVDQLTMKAGENTKNKK